jgi:hypothetical protein
MAGDQDVRGTGAGAAPTPTRWCARARPADADALYELALAGGSGLTNLPADRDALRAKLEAGRPR